MSTPNGVYCVVLTTTATDEQAEELAKKVVTAKLGACVQVQKIKSFYVWKGDTRAEPECLLFIKTRTAQYAQLESFIRANHAYDTPEIIQIPILAGSAEYFSWMNEATGP